VRKSFGYAEFVAKPALVKKYGNRRLYDTSVSRYVTLNELAERIADGETFRIEDAKSGRDLTAATLTQIIVEGRELARLLPVPLLEQLIRLGDDALAEFFGTWVMGSLELYLQTRDQLRAPQRWNPFAAFAALSNPFAGAADEVAELRREIENLRREVADSRRKAK